MTPAGTGATPDPAKLVLCVIDSLAPEMLDRAIAEGRAPTLATLVERGVYVRDCVSTFPSLTPVAASSIGTGVGPDRHEIPSMVWYHRGEERYVDYGSSWGSSQAVGFDRQLYDLVYNLNLAHLSRRQPTVFEALEDAGLRTAGTTYLIYRGRTRHEPAANSVYSVLARAAQFRHAVWGPTELFYADVFASRRTDCSSLLGMPGQRDRHAGCVGAHLVEQDLFDFMLFSLPDNDTFSHKNGPDAQVESIAGADRALARLMEAGGGPDAFLAEHAVIVVSDHSQNAIAQPIALPPALTPWRILAPSDAAPGGADIAVCPVSRFASVYVLDPDRRDALAPDVAARCEELPGIDLVVRRGNGEGIVSSARGELRFAPGGPLTDARGGRWSIEGAPAALALAVRDGRVSSRVYPHALERLWSALNCATSGDVLLSPAPGHEFVDWGSGDHVGGGSHGSLHRSDSLGVLLFCGTGPESSREVGQWTIQDAARLALAHFGVDPPAAA